MLYVVDHACTCVLHCQYKGMCSIAKMYSWIGLASEVSNVTHGPIAFAKLWKVWMDEKKKREYML